MLGRIINCFLNQCFFDEEYDGDHAISGTVCMYANANDRDADQNRKFVLNIVGYDSNNRVIWSFNVQ